VFALQPIAAGERLIEYTGEVTSWRHAAARQRSETGHTFVFGLSDGRVIDDSRGGNSARFINHACAPNCEAIETGDRVFIHALMAIEPGDELFIDYGPAVDRKITDDIRAPTMHAIAALPPAVSRCWRARQAEVRLFGSLITDPNEQRTSVGTEKNERFRFPRLLLTFDVRIEATDRLLPSPMMPPASHPASEFNDQKISSSARFRPLAN
jgi:hypothetical protein